MKPAVTESALDGVIERLLLESRQVAAMLLDAATLKAEFDRVTTARQVRHIGASGTADLVVRYWLGAACTAMLLAENKIDTGFTPDQPARDAAPGLALVFGIGRLDNMRAVAGQETVILDALSKLQRLRETWNGLEEPCAVPRRW